MKLRFDHQSIRLRVRKSDIEKLSQEGFIMEFVQFPQGILTYRLEINPVDRLVSAVIDAETITVSIPADQATAWINSETVGIYATLPTTHEGLTLNVLIEKDFPCRHNSSDDNADTFEELSNLI